MLRLIASAARRLCGTSAPQIRNDRGESSAERSTVEQREQGPIVPARPQDYADWLIGYFRNGGLCSSYSDCRFDRRDWYSIVADLDLRSVETWTKKFVVKSGVKVYPMDLDRVDLFFMDGFRATGWSVRLNSDVVPLLLAQFQAQGVCLGWTDEEFADIATNSQRRMEFAALVAQAFPSESSLLLPAPARERRSAEGGEPHVPATQLELATWIFGYIASGQEWRFRQYFEHMDDDIRTVLRDMEFPAACGSAARGFIVPRGVTLRFPDGLGHCSVYMMEGYRFENFFGVPLSNDVALVLLRAYQSAGLFLDWELPRFIEFLTNPANRETFWSMAEELGLAEKLRQKAEENAGPAPAARAAALEGVIIDAEATEVGVSFLPPNVTVKEPTGSLVATVRGDIVPPEQVLDLRVAAASSILAAGMSPPPPAPGDEPVTHVPATSREYARWLLGYLLSGGWCEQYKAEPMSPFWDNARLAVADIVVPAPVYDDSDYSPHISDYDPEPADRSWQHSRHCLDRCKMIVPAGFSVSNHGRTEMLYMDGFRHEGFFGVKLYEDVAVMLLQFFKSKGMFEEWNLDQFVQFLLDPSKQTVFKRMATQANLAVTDVPQLTFQAA